MVEVRHLVWGDAEDIPISAPVPANAARGELNRTPCTMYKEGWALTMPFTGTSTLNIVHVL